MKRILPTLAEDRELVRMFLDEARLVVQLDHPGIVPVHELGKLGRAATTSRWTTSPGAICARSPIGSGAAASGCRSRSSAHVAARVADALDHAHRGRGADGGALRVVHRDVSPANVLVGFDGAVRMIDFGIAQAAHRPPPPAARPRCCAASSAT